MATPPALRYGAGVRILSAERRAHAGAVTVGYGFEPARRDVPAGEVWFRVEERWADWIHTGPEPAAAALLFAAMALGEDIELCEAVSSRFHYGFQRAVEHFHLWWPQLRPIALHAPARVPVRRRGPAVASCFSGGVDSFHALYAHVDDAIAPDLRLTHLLFAHGLDIPLGDDRYAALATEFSDLAASFGLELIGVATNLRAALDRHVLWQTAHGACLCALALFLSGGIRRCVVPSTNRQSTLFIPCGSNPITDPLLASEGVEIAHYGTHVSRIGKILALAPRREAREHLRVCWQNLPGARNCGHCVKCLKTMMPLAITGALEHFAVFPPLPPWRAIDRACFAGLDLSTVPPEVSYAEELDALARAHGVHGFPRWRLIEAAARRRAKGIVRRLWRR